MLLEAVEKHPEPEKKCLFLKSPLVITLQQASECPVGLAQRCWDSGCLGGAE